jgi:hypothetical protein
VASPPITPACARLAPGRSRRICEDADAVRLLAADRCLGATTDQCQVVQTASVDGGLKSYVPCQFTRNLVHLLQ